MFLTVIVLMTGALFIGGSFVEKKKAEVVTHDINTFQNASVKEDNSVPLRQANHRKAVTPGTTRSEVEDYRIGTIEPTGYSIGCSMLPAPIPEEEKKEDSIEWLMCNLETEAEYPGGVVEWQRYLNKNIRCPEDTTVEELHVTVMVQFVVDEKGNVCEVEAVGGSELLRAEAERVIKQSRKWKPAKKLSNGSGVRSFKKQPVIFRFETEE